MKKRLDKARIEAIASTIAATGIEGLSLDDLAELAAAANSVRRNKQFQIIKDCEHDSVTTTAVDPWKTSEAWICNCCGLSVAAYGTGAPSRGPIAMAHGDVAYRSKQPPVVFHVSPVMRYAIEHPRRFEQSALEEIFEGSPWTIEEIASHDQGSYYVVDRKFKSKDEAHNSVFNHD